MRYRSFWKVPSSTAPGKFYTVVVYPNRQTECHCANRIEAQALYPCWHVIVAAALADDPTRAYRGWGRIDDARHGELDAQLVLLYHRTMYLVRGGNLESANLHLRAVSRYLAARLVHGSAGVVKRVYWNEARTLLRRRGKPE